MELLALFPEEKLMLLTDIVIKHTRKSRKGEPDATFVMHPFENSQGANAGKYEVLRDIVRTGQPKRKRSAHVSAAQLAQMYARELMPAFGIRLRVRSAANDYPTPPPGKKVPLSCIQPGSRFEALVKKVDTTQPVDNALKLALARIEIDF